jgi:DNA-nicking Smr family endonuclease
VARKRNHKGNSRVMASRTGRYAANMAVMARTEKMPRVDLTGLSLSEAEAEVAALIDEAQEAALRDYEITMVDLGCIGSSAIDRELAPAC